MRRVRMMRPSSVSSLRDPANASSSASRSSAIVPDGQQQTDMRAWGMRFNHLRVFESHDKSPQGRSCAGSIDTNKRLRRVLGYSHML
eukprot:1302695-Pyramimonas_sp.AAC.1